MKRCLLVAGVCILVGALLFCSAESQAQVTGTTQQQTTTYDQERYQQYLTDSLRAIAASATAEPSLQHIFDSLGYDVNVATDELGKELFCGKGGLNTATMVIEVAGSAVYAMSGYYKKSDTSTFYQLFGPSAVPGDSVTFTFSSFDSIGFYMKPNLPGEHYTWLTQSAMNKDHFDHAWVFSTGVPHQYLIAWEDYYSGGDKDYNDLVIKITFKNFPPLLHLCGWGDDAADETSTSCDNTVVQCSPQPYCINITASDPNCQGDSITVTKISGEGTFTAVKGFRTLSTQHCFTPSTPGTYTFVFRVTDELGAYDQDTIHVTVVQGVKPTVIVPDTSFFLCSAGQICLPISITDPNCDVLSVTTNLGSYSGTVYGYDQVSRIVQMGGTVTQVGGGQPGKVLTVGSDFVAPVNTQSGVSVTLPNFAFASTVIDYGSFPSGGNAATYMLNAPTCMTYTTSGAGGPDGGSGDGAVDFASGNYAILGFPQTITTCNGAKVDVMLFTNTIGSGTAQLMFKNGSTVVQTVSVTVPAGTSGSGSGGVAVDLPDGVTFDRVRIASTSSSFEIDAIAARTAPSTSKADICFTADTAGTYKVIVTATDSCGNVGADTGRVVVTMNRAPVANAGADLSKFLCASGEICFPVSFSDPDGNLKLKELISGPGTLSSDQICFTPTASGTSTFIIRATDSCGVTKQDTVNVVVTINSAPIANNPSPITKFLCAAAQQCNTFTATDINGGTLTWSKLSGSGSITSAGVYCFTPTASGTYTATVVVADSCGAKDTTSITYNVTLNSAPVATDPTSPVAITQCTPQQVCYTFGASDANGGTLTWSRLSGDGTVSSSGQWCFTPTGSGSYTAVVAVTDSCGVADTTSLTYNVTINGAPTIVFGNDTTVFQCTAQSICLPYTVSDPQGLSGLTEAMISGFGTIDTANNKVCFTPTSAGSYTIIVGVTDPCGASDRDTIVVTVTFGQVADIVCPTAPINVTLCSTPLQICQAITVTPSSATVTTSLGTYSGGQLCFTADTAGTYNIRMIASSTCGADTCWVAFNVVVSQPPDLVCPSAQTRFICQPGQICVPVGGAAVATWTVTPIGSYSSGNVCFNADTAGHYVLKVKASTPCGVDSCNLVVDVAINSKPVATDPVTPVDTFMCASASVCRQFSATDANGGTLTWVKLSGDGTVSSGGQWCFTAAGTASYSVIAKVVDSCGAADTVHLTYNVILNSAPDLALGNDTTMFQCLPAMICLPYTLTDANSNVSTIELKSGAGTITLDPKYLCFTPSTSGTYVFIAEVTDACGAKDLDTLNVFVQLNRAPIVNAGRDTTVFQCAAAQICWPAGASDPDGNLSNVQLVSGPGTFDGTRICFTPTGSLHYEFVLKATDACGAIGYDTVVVYYTLNRPPTADAGRDSTLFQCTAAPICWAASCSDADGNLTGGALVSGPGYYDGSHICFTPTASGTYQFILEATDACGSKGRDTSVVTVTLNSAPVCSVPHDTTIFQCTAAPVCLPVSASDVNGNFLYCQIVSGPGTLSGGNWCYTPSATQSVTVQVRCVDACGAECTSQFRVDFVLNQAPQIAFGIDTTVFQCSSSEICLPYTVFDPNDPRPRTVSLVSGSGTLNTSTNQVCFTPATAGTYTFIIRVQDECGAGDQDTINAVVTLNRPPVAGLGPDQSLFMCDNSPTICWPASCSDPDGNLTDCLFNGPGTYDGSQVCFQAATSGTYMFTLRATDACGLQHTDTCYVNVTINSAPTAAFGNDTTLAICQPQPVCLSYAVSDPDGMNRLTEVLVSGYGSIDTSLNKVCFTPTASGTYDLIISVTDSCGASDLDTVRAIVTMGQRASITCPSGTISKFLCTAGQICQSLPVSPSGATVTTSFGTYSGGNLCFQADTAGTYHIQVIASTFCGADTCNLTFAVTLNRPPVAAAGADQNVFQCAPAAICWPVSCSDPDNNLDSCKLVSGPGTYDGSGICFTPTGSGTYTFVMRAVDQCGLSSQDTVLVNVTINSAPTVAFGNDTSLFLCQPQPVCLGYVVNDPNGLSGLAEVMVSGYGSIDTALNKVCFTPTAAGTYDFIVSVTDSCGLSDRDTVRAVITFGEMAHITCPSSPINASLCAAGPVCQQLTIAPTGATVTTSFGTYSGGNLCFQADTSGVYHIRVIAAASCSSDTCNLTFNVTIGSAAQITCPPTQTRFICQPGSVCIPVSVLGEGATVTVTPIGSYSGGNVCFPADTSGHYVLKVKASTTCGSDSCQLVADITIDAPPVAADPATPKDTFLCASSQICYQFAATDVNGGTLTWSKLSGVGSVSGTGQWCFTPTAAGSYSVVAAVADSCGKSDTTTLTYNITLNGAPTISLSKDTTLNLCASVQVCLPYTVSDPNNNIVLEAIVSGAGTLDTAANSLCFTPAASGTYTFIAKAVDACGLIGYDTVNATVNIGQAAHVTCPSAQSKFLCQSGSVCVPVTVTGTGVTVAVTPIGSYSGGNVCFPADTSGHYVLKVKATASCGSDSCYVVMDITVDGPPVAVNPPSPVDTFLCVPAQVGYQFSATDPNGGTLTWSKLTGAGAVSGTGLWTFTPTASGSFTVTVVVADSCGKSDTTTLTYNVTLNLPPVVSLGAVHARRDTTLFVCGSRQLCVPYVVTDPNNNVVLEQLVSGIGSIDTLNNQICFTPPTAGIYQIIVKVTDACQAFGLDTMNLSVTFNSPPSVNAGSDQNFDLCTASSICWPITVSDPNNNIDSVRLLTPAGSIITDQTGRKICFTPDTSGIYRFIVRVVDACGASAQDTVVQTVHVNTPPVCHVPSGTTTYFQCTPAQVALPVSATDIDGNYDHCEIVTGPGSIVAGQWVYTPSADEFWKIVVQCVDQCGAICKDSFYVRFNLNAPPVVDAGKDTTFFVCQTTQLCRPIAATDEDHNLQSVELVSPLGTYDPVTHNICFTPTFAAGTTKTFEFVVKATDSCGATDYDTTNITVRFNAPPVIQAPSDFSAYLEQMGPLCFDVNVTDDNGSTTVSVAPVGTYDANAHQVCFTPHATGSYCLVITATDACQAVSVDTVCIDVVVDQCIHVQIEKTHNTYQGRHEEVNIYLNGSGKQIGGFDFLIAYDASILAAMGAKPGPLFTSCGWEYFTYRLGADGNCGSACPSGLIRIVGIGETNNGAYHPGCYLEGEIGSLALIDFVVTNDRTMQCQFSPISFFWQACTDNALTTLAGDTVWVSRKVLDFELHNITDNSHALPSYYGVPDSCLRNIPKNKGQLARCVDFTNGGVDIVCSDSIDARGDINLNEVAYEIADAVMYSNYFVMGLRAFGTDSHRQQGSIAASDCNADGLTLTVADLVYLIRVVIGDAEGMPKPVPGASLQAMFSVTGDVLQITRTDALIGAVYVELEGDVRPELHSAASMMEMKYHFDGQNTRVLISNLNGKAYLETGPILILKGAKSVKSVEVGSYDGAVVVAKLENLPREFSLSQNYPNPFNPLTTIEFGLPVASDWQLSVYNILGQEVASWRNHSEAGYHKIGWDASRYASGVYFYRLSAGSFSATRKMVLLK